MMDKAQSIITLEDYPSQRQVYVYRSDQQETIRIYKEEDIFEAETLFPGLKIKVSDLFIIDED
jgi:Uma2 family endonuclease